MKSLLSNIERKVLKKRQRELEKSRDKHKAKWQKLQEELARSRDEVKSLKAALKKRS